MSRFKQYFFSISYALCAIPTYSWVTFIPGSTPFGIFPLMLLLKKIKRQDLYFFIFFILIGMLNINDYYSIFELTKLAIGPLIYIFLRNLDLTLENFPLRPLFYMLLIFMIDAYFSGSFESFRGATFITKEPSHSSHAFYLISFLIFLINPRYKNLLFFLGIFFLMTNKSSTSLLYLLSFTLVFYKGFFQKKLLMKIFFLAVLIAFLIFNEKIFLTDSSKTKYLSTIQSVKSLVKDEVDSIEILRAGGGRLIMSINAYVNSQPFFGYGIGSGDNIENLNLHNVEYRLDNFRFTDEQKLSTGSYFSQISFEVGWTWIILMSLYLLRSCNRNLESYVILSLSFLQLFLLSSTTLASPWLLAGLVSNKNFSLVQGIQDK